MKMVSKSLPQLASVSILILIFGCSLASSQNTPGVSPPNSGNDGYIRIKLKKATFISVAAVASAVLALVMIIILIKYVTRKTSEPLEVSQSQEAKVVLTWSGLYKFSTKEIDNALNYYTQKFILGSGSAGHVYRGVLPSGQIVAIKHIYKAPAMPDSFRREVEELSKIRHPNLVSLLGYCIDEEEHYLVYEYCPNGDLAYNLLKSDNVLPWDKRVKILRDCALALRFLHRHPDGSIVHRDIKLTNILLTGNMEPKLADFGLARMAGMKETDVYTTVRGTIGYMDPEYMTNAKLTCSSDIYSFGIVMLQLLSGRKAIQMDVASRDTITQMAKDISQGKRELNEFVDPRLNGDFNRRAFKYILEVAALCVSSTSAGRPSIEELYNELDSILNDMDGDMSSRSWTEPNASILLPLPVLPRLLDV